MKKHLILLLLVFGLAATLRFYQLGKIPEGFHADEAAFGYNAYSLLETGKDEYGVSYPLILKSFGDYKGALYSYISIPFIALFGLNEFSVRFPSALFGTIAVLITYLLVLHLSQKRSVALMAAVLHAINPSALFLSRVQSDPLVAGVLFLGGLYCLFMWLKKNRWVFLGLSLILWTAASYGYVTTRIFLLVFIPILILTERLYKNKKQLLLTIAVYIALITCSFFAMSGEKGDRLMQVNPFTKIDVQLPLDEAIREDGVMDNRGLITRIMHNKVFAYGRSITRLAVSYMSPEFLFFESQQPIREQIPNSGVLLAIELPFIIAGLYFMFRHRRPWRFLAIAWILSGILSLSFASAESPNIHRFYILLLPIHLISAYGIVELIKTISHTLLKISISIVLFVLYSLTVWVFLHEMFVHQPVHFPFYRGFAYKDLVQKLPNYYSKYSKIIVTKGNESPYIYILFFGAFDPMQYQLSGSHRDLDYLGFDKYVFVPYDCPSFNEYSARGKMTYDKSMLLIQRGGCNLGSNDKLLDKIYWREGSEAFQLVEYKSSY